MVNVNIEKPDYIGYSKLYSSFLFDKVIKDEKKDTCFDKYLTDFKEVKEYDAKISKDDYFALIYPNNISTMVFVSNSNDLYIHKDGTYLVKFNTDIEDLVNYINTNGEKISLNDLYK